jgi:tetratricopeptide (TPR) repeat protein
MRQRLKPFVWRAGIFTVLALVLVWQITSKGIAAYLANASPEYALAVHPRQPAAVINIIDQKISIDERDGKAVISTVETNSNGDRRDREKVESALLEEPLNARALRILGQLADKAGDKDRAWQFMQAAVRYSVNESYAVTWLTDRSLEKGDYEGALRYSDILLRTNPQFLYFVMPALVTIAGDKGANAKLVELLLANPPWRSRFFGAFASSGIPDARMPLELLVALKGSPNPPSADDLRGYLSFLIDHKFYSLAYYAWLQFLPAEQLNSLGLLFNGNFETVPSGLPFDWVIRPGAGVSIEIGRAPGGEGRALAVTFEQGRVEFGDVSELLALAPGRYRFTGKASGEILGARGLKWRVTCAGNATIGESSMIAGRLPTGKSIEFNFTVPPVDCAAQYVHLDLDARMSSEQFVSGSLWLGDLRVERVANANDK